MACLEQGLHKHRPFTLIIDYLHHVQSQWSSLYQEYASQVPKAEASYHKYRPLINYYEKELIAASACKLYGRDREQCITGDYLALKKGNEEVIYFNQYVQDIYKDGLILLVDKFHSHFQRLSGLFQRTQYLGDISEDLIY
jgi:hypothetical protein